MPTNAVIVAPLKAQDVAAARELIIQGLAERWGVYEPRFNPDLQAFPASYNDAVILVAKQGGHVVGIGILKPLGPTSAQILRMSVAGPLRRTGVGSLILSHILRHARESGFSTISLETTSTWVSAIEFYKKHGFRPTHQHDEDTYFIYKPSEA